MYVATEGLKIGLGCVQTSTHTQIQYTQAPVCVATTGLKVVVLGFVHTDTNTDTFNLHRRP